MVMGQMGRDLLLRGESAWEISVDGAVELYPLAQFEIVGSRTVWDYQVEVEQPDGTATTRRLPGEQVVHLRYAVDPQRPWKGLGPLDGASTTTKLAGRLETRLSEEAGASVGVLIPTPHVDAQLQTDLSKLKGRLALVESTTAGWGEGKQGAPRGDWRPQRIGADPPMALDSLRTSAALSIAAAAGVPPALLMGAIVPACGNRSGCSSTPPSNPSPAWCFPSCRPS